MIDHLRRRLDGIDADTSTSTTIMAVVTAAQTFSSTVQCAPRHGWPQLQISSTGRGAKYQDHTLGGLQALPPCIPVLLHAVNVSIQSTSQPQTLLVYP